MNIIDQPHNVQEANMSRKNNLGYVSETLGNMNLNDRQQQLMRNTQTSIVIFLDISHYVVNAFFNKYVFIKCTCILLFYCNIIFKHKDYYIILVIIL